MTNNFLCLFPIKRFICNACYKLCACSLGKSFVVCSKSSTGRDTKVFIRKKAAVMLPLATSTVPACTHAHTHTHTFNGPFSGTTRVSRYQIGKTNLDFTEARDSER